MLPLVLIVAGGGLAFLLTQKRAAAGQPPKPGSALAPSDSKGLQFLQQGFGVAASAIAYQVGIELDKLLGGDGKGLTSVIAAAGLALAAFLIFVVGCTGVGLVVIALTVIAYAAASIVTDASRLAYGQSGAEDDWEKRWVEEHGKIFSMLKQRLPNLSDDRLLRFTVPIADGYMAMLNRLNYLEWMGRNTDPARVPYHATFGHDRGYFVGAVREDGTLIDALPYHSDRQDHLNRCLPGELTSYQASQVVSVLGMWSGGGATQTANVTVTHDTLAGPLIEGGRYLCNAHAFVTHMQDAWGIGMSEASHAAWGLSHGKFEGTINTGGFSFLSVQGQAKVPITRGPGAALLTYGGKDLYWRDNGGNAGFYVRVPKELLA